MKPTESETIAAIVQKTGLSQDAVGRIWRLGVNNIVDRMTEPFENPRHVIQEARRVGIYPLDALEMNVKFLRQWRREFEIEHEEMEKVKKGEREPAPAGIRRDVIEADRIANVAGVDLDLVFRVMSAGAEYLEDRIKKEKESASGDGRPWLAD